jgi:plastocyanin
MNNRMTLAVGGMLFAAALSGCGGGSTSSSYSLPTSPTVTTPTTTTVPPTPTAGADVTITIVGMNGTNSYSPNPATVKVGQTVAWRNGDGLAHTATADAGSFDTGTVAAAATSRAITMGTAGSFPYHCTIHGLAMAGTLVVTP